jgi:hypothetical protein
MNDASHTDSSFSAGDDARDLSSVASKWGLCGHQTLPRWLPPNVPGSHLKIPRSGTPQDGQLTLRLASAHTLQDIWVHSYSTSWWLIGPALVLGCCPRRGHLALRLASTVHGFGASTSPISTAKASWEQPSMAGALSCHAPLHACGQVGEVRRAPVCHSEGRLALVRVLTLPKFWGIHSHLHCHFAILLLVIE